VKEGSTIKAMSGEERLFKKKKTNKQTNKQKRRVYKRMKRNGREKS
jgi:hypothetical protein